MGNVLTKGMIEHLNNSSPVAQLTGLGSRLDEGLMLSPLIWPGTTYYVDTTLSNDVGNDGKTFGEAFKTIQKAVDVVSDHDIIFVRGDIAEAVVTPALAGGVGAMYVKIIGVQAMGIPFENEWASGGVIDSNTSPCLILRSVGWHIEGFKFIVPDSAEAIRSLALNGDDLVYDGGSDNWAYRSKIIRNQFYGATGGKWGQCGIRLYGAEHEMEISGNYFSFIHQANNSGKCIHLYSSNFAVPYRHRLFGNIFLESDAQICFGRGANACLFIDNIFQGTGKTAYNNKPKLDLGSIGGGIGNIVAKNIMGGTFTAAAAEYIPAGASDDWRGNYTSQAGISKDVPQ